MLFPWSRHHFLLLLRGFIQLDIKFPAYFWIFQSPNFVPSVHGLVLSSNP